MEVGIEMIAELVAEPVAVEAAEVTDIPEDEKEDAKADEVADFVKEEVPLGRKNTNRSLASEILEQKQKEKKPEEDDYSLFYLFKRMGIINKSEWRRYVVGVIFACLTGCVFPAFGVVYGKFFHFLLAVLFLSMV